MAIIVVIMIASIIVIIAFLNNLSVFKQQRTPFTSYFIFELDFFVWYFHFHNRACCLLIAQGNI